jgi:N utilization substance protein A
MYSVIMGRTTEFDIDLDEFSDEIETWIIDELKNRLRYGS